MLQGTINPLDLVLSISNAIDLIAPSVANHHKRVAYTTLVLAAELGYSLEARSNLVIAGLLHDIGALSFRERTRLMDDEQQQLDLHLHAEVGHLLLEKFRLFSSAAEIIRFHHVPWAYGKGETFHGRQVPIASHLLHLADRIDAAIGQAYPVLSRATRITASIERGAGALFPPEMVQAFKRFASRDEFWLDLVSPGLDSRLLKQASNVTMAFSLSDLRDFAEVMAHVIDFRCRFTATHSCGVAAVAEALAEFTGFSETECRKMRIAGYLHDIGKLAVSPEIIEKPGPLTSDEFDEIRIHPYYTYRILEPIRGLGEIIEWAALHHERLRGDGYPGRRNAASIPLGSRIVAVADTFTALSEHRPYRQAKSHARVIDTLQEMARDRLLDSRVLCVLMDNYSEIDRRRQWEQECAKLEYEAFSGVLQEGRAPARVDEESS